MIGKILLSVALFLAVPVMVHAGDLNQEYRDYLAKLPQNYYELELERRIEATHSSAFSQLEADIYQDEIDRFCIDLESADMLRLARCAQLIHFRNSSLCDGGEATHKCPESRYFKDAGLIAEIYDRAKEIRQGSDLFGGILQEKLQFSKNNEERLEPLLDTFYYTIDFAEGRVSYSQENQKALFGGRDNVVFSWKGIENYKQNAFNGLLNLLPKEMGELYAELYYRIKTKGYDKYLNQKHIRRGEALLSKYPQHAKVTDTPAVEAPLSNREALQGVKAAPAKVEGPPPNLDASTDQAGISETSVSKLLMVLGGVALLGLMLLGVWLFRRR